MIYLDYAATTPVDPIVAEAMQGCLTIDGCFANPASQYASGNAASKMIEQARATTANTINASAEAIIFTSGATEANNLAIKGLMSFYQNNGKHMITSRIEHLAILDPCKALVKQGYEVTYVDPEPHGAISISAIEAAIRPDTTLISIMHVNNETGVINDIDAIAHLAKQHGIYFHTDASQSLGKCRIDIEQTPIDLLSMSAHKCYGPKGIGALYIRQHPKVRLIEQINGGRHQYGLRSGTLPTHQIVGMATALELMQNHGTKEQQQITTYHDSLLEKLQASLPVTINGERKHKLPNIMNLQFDGVDQQQLLKASPNLAFAIGSACNAKAIAPSHVLQSMGLSLQQIRQSIRLSFGRYTTRAMIDQTANTLIDSYSKIKSEPEVI